MPILIETPNNRKMYLMILGTPKLSLTGACGKGPKILVRLIKERIGLFFLN